MKFNNSDHNNNSIKSFISSLKNYRLKKYLLIIFMISTLCSLMSIFGYILNQPFIEKNGILKESFALIPLAYIFMSIAIITLITLVIIYVTANLKNWKDKAYSETFSSHTIGFFIVIVQKI